MTLDQLLDYLRPFYPTWDDGLAKHMVHQFALPGDRQFRHFSRGVWMKVALVASLAYRPRLLVLDLQRTRSAHPARPHRRLLEQARGRRAAI